MQKKVIRLHEGMVQSGRLLLIIQYAIVKNISSFHGKKNKDEIC